jgi:hypothetical protein
MEFFFRFPCSLAWITRGLAVEFPGCSGCLFVDLRVKDGINDSNQANETQSVFRQNDYAMPISSQRELY